MILVEQYPDRTIRVEGKEYLYFGGTNYLGVGADESFQKILFQSIQKWGSYFGSSRNANVQLKVYQEVEEYLAAFVGSESSILLSSGMLAGKIVVEFLSTTTDRFFHFPNLHAALFSPSSLPFFIKNEINPELLSNKNENITILLDGIPSMQTKILDLDVLNQISNSKKITLVVDESHTFGILGTNGNGIFASISNPKIIRKIMISSLGKAFGLTGGCIASDTVFCNQIRDQNTFVSAAGMNPAFAQTFMNAKYIYENKFQKLKANLDYLSKILYESSDFDFTKNYPIINIFSERLNQSLQENGIIITNFKYATTSKNLNRIIITANHTHADLQKLVIVLNQK